MLRLNIIISLSLMLMKLVFLAKNTSESSSFKKEVCENLPPFCRYLDSRREYNLSEGFLHKQEKLKCANGFDAEMLRRFERFLSECQEKKPSYASISRVAITFSIHIRAPAPHWSILNDSFHVFKLTNRQSNYSVINMFISNLKGFAIDSSLASDFNITCLEFYTDFNLYKKNRVVKNCDEFLHDEDDSSNRSSLRQFIFPNGLARLSIKRPQALYPVCSLFFRNANIPIFYIYYMSHSYFMKNSLAFIDSDDSQNMMNFNSSIENLYLWDVYMIDLDSKLLNANIFARITYLEVKGHLNSIGANVFLPFKKLNEFRLYSPSFLRMIWRQGIEWIKGINADVSVNVTNRTEFQLNQKYITSIHLISFNLEKYDFNLGGHGDDANFCLFVDYPFRQMVFISHEVFMTDMLYSEHLYKTLRFTCTELWLYQFYPQLASIDLYKSLDIIHAAFERSNSTNCDFKKRIQMCNRSDYHLSTLNRPIYYWFDAMVGLEFSFLIILPLLFGAFGIVTNLIVIRVILHEKNKMTMRNKQYIYMSLHCLSNILICFIQFLNLLNECQYPYSGLFCSPVRHLVGIQYLRIIFGEYLNSVLRLVSNFAYFGFSICRLAKIGTEHSRFTRFFNQDLNIKVYMSVNMFFSAGLSVCNWLQFEINHYYVEWPFPFPFIFDVFPDQNDHDQKWIFKSSYMAIFVINIIYNFINYFLFVFVHLIVDIILIKKLWQVIREKEEKMREMQRSEKEMEKTSKENEESKRRAVIMVICNSTLNFIFKIPLFTPAFNDFRIIIHNSNLSSELLESSFNYLNIFSSPFNFKFYCLSEKSCQIFLAFGNCLFLASLSTILIFLKHFDMNFKSAFATIFHRPNNNNNNN